MSSQAMTLIAAGLLLAGSLPAKAADNDAKIERSINEAAAARQKPHRPDDTIGVYVLGGYGPGGAVLNASPQAFVGDSYNVSGVSPKFPELGLGARYFPLPWLMIDAAYLPVYFSGKVQENCAGPNCVAGSASGVGGSAFQFTANWVKTLSKEWRLFAGGGLGQYDLNESQGGGGVATLSSGSGIQQTADFTRPLIRAGAEWKPRPRFGIGVFENFFPTTATLRLYPEANDGSGTGATTGSTAPLLSIQLPRFSTEATLAVYF